MAGERTWICWGAVLLSGCAGVPSTPQPFTPDKGCVVSSLIDERHLVLRSFGSATVRQYFVRAGGPVDAQWLQLTPRWGPGFGGPHAALDVPGGVGVVHVRYVEPGLYRMGPYEITEQRRGIAPWVTPIGFGVPFEVRTGRCTYLGRSTLMARGYQFRWSDERAFDFEQVRPLLPPALAALPMHAIEAFEFPEMAPLD